MPALRASMMRNPSPELTAIISAATTTSHAMPSARRRPTRSRGRIAGRSTRRAICPGERPKLRPAFQCVAETPPTALIAAIVSGKTEATKMMKTAERSPTPNQRMASGIQASAEIGRTISTSGASASPPRRYQASRIPSGTPTETASRYPQVTRKSDATTCLTRKPFCASSAIARATASGPGRSGTRPSRMARSHATSSAARPAKGSNRFANAADPRVGRILVSFNRRRV